MIKLMPLNFDTVAHRELVARMVLSPALQLRHGDVASDVRLAMWQARRGRWIVAVDQGRLMGVAVVDQQTNRTAELIWLEVAEQYRRRGIGRALLNWSRTQATTLTWTSEERAVGFYERVLSMKAPANRR